MKGFYVKGFVAGGTSCGIKKGGKPDLAVILCEKRAAVAGVFTRNSVKAAPVLVDMERIKAGGARGVIVNSGNANACTGARGMRDALKAASAAEKVFSLKKGEMLVASTGVIGIRLPVEKIEAALPALRKKTSPGGWRAASHAIMTTDAFPKTASARRRINGRDVSILGIAKGAGMICPDMATMLCFIATDANIKGAALRKALSEAAGKSFNRISVDNDMSTNDTVLVFASGEAGGAPIKPGSRAYKTFLSMLAGVSVKLARLIVKDGEGATRIVEITVKGAASSAEAETAARRLAGSLLVKTALFGGDPNWGRIMAAIGSVDVRFDESRAEIRLGGVKVFSRGVDTGKERQAAKRMKKDEVEVEVDLKAGKHSFALWTSDLTYDYIRINSSYRS